MTVDPASRGWNEHRHRWDVPAGTIRTADLADGSVTTPKLAAHAVSQIQTQGGVSVDPTTTSTTFVDEPDLAITLTTGGGDLIAVVVNSFLSTVGSGNATVTALSLDGAAEVGDQHGMGTIVNARWNQVNLVRFTGVAVGTHTVKARWRVTGGTTDALGTLRSLLILELKR